MELIPLLLLAGVVIITILIIYLALTNKIIFKMAARNFTRRKAQSVIVIAGLMIGTSLISAALIVQDTMTYSTVVDVYESLGEIDEEIYGTSQFGTVVYFNESIYDSISSDLSTVSGIEAVAPVIREYGSAFDVDTSLGEPRALLLGLDSQIMRSTVFGDLNEDKYYTDELNENEVAINSRLAHEMDASVGDTIQLSYGVQNLSNPLIPDHRQIDLEIVKIIKEMDLYGKANYNKQKTLFFELDVLQQLLERPNEINDIWISNKGDYEGGEQYASKVNEHIQNALDEAVGMADVGFSLDSFNDSIVLTRDKGFFPLENAHRLSELEQQDDASIMYGLTVPTITLNMAPTNYRSVMGVSSTEPSFPTTDEGSIHFLSGPMAEFNISEGMPVVIMTMASTGEVQPSTFTAHELSPGHEALIPEEIRAGTLGVIKFNTSQQLVHLGMYEGEMASFVMASGLDLATLEQTRTTIVGQMTEDLTGEDLNLQVQNIKEDNLEMGREAGESMGSIFIILSMFSIIAGVVLIINIFVMMGEERKSEMGMARAVGMKTKHLVRMYVFEGSLYAFVAAIIGSFLGMAFGWLIIQVFDYVFGQGDAFGGGPSSLQFHFTWASMVFAFCAGLLITFATIFFASTRIANLNIIRAIRRIPEPITARSKKRSQVMGAALAVVGLLFCSYGFTSNEGVGWMIGLPFILLGAAMVADRWFNFRVAITIASLLIIFVMVQPIDIPVVSDAEYSDSSFMVNGLFLVLAGIFIVMYNSDILLKLLQLLLGWHKTTRAVLKTAISYPMANKMKTGMTLGMFALIIYIVTIIAVFAAIQSDQSDSIVTEQSGGYDILGNTNPGTPFENLSKETLPSELKAFDIEQLETMTSAYVTVLDYDQETATAGMLATPLFGEVEQYQLLGVSETFLSTNGFTLMERDDVYENDRDAWEALADDSSVCIIDGTMLAFAESQMASEMVGAYVGGTITITDMGGQNRTRVLTVIGVMHQSLFVQGIVLMKDVVKNEYGGVDSLLIIELGEGENTDTVAKAFEVTYLELGLQTADIQEIINSLISAITNFMYLFEGFLGIGLLIGIAGIGIISYRNVIERRQQIGMLRAIGFKKGMIAWSFLIETSFVTLLAIGIGVVLGILTGWQMYNDTMAGTGSTYDVPKTELLIISLIAYGATLIFTFWPSIKAAKIPPAEALRYTE